MDQIKEAFRKVKNEMDLLKEELDLIKINMQNIKNNLDFLTKNSINLNQTDNPTLNLNSQTQNNFIPTDNSTDFSTIIKNLPFKGLKKQNLLNSIGNNRVSTDRQTIRQTDNQTQNSTYSSTGNEGVDIILKNNFNEEINNTSQLITKLEFLKSDLKFKLKSLTSQEMLVFSSIYQFEDQGEIIDYPFLSSKLKLSQSSVRDYVQRISNKGIPLIKEKINNKRIILKISPDFKKLASLNTIISMRESSFRYID